MGAGVVGINGIVKGLINVQGMGRCQQWLGVSKNGGYI